MILITPILLSLPHTRQRGEMPEKKNSSKIKKAPNDRQDEMSALAYAYVHEN